MAISFGPKLNLLYNALIGESYFDSLRLFLQSIDQLVNGSVINATQVTPPSSPNPGDAYLLIGGTPGGSWTGQAGNIAVWDSQLTTSGTNTVVPGWIFLTPKAGWTVWNIALASLYVYNGTSWSAVGGTGANFPTNTDITSMTGIPNTTINNTGYTYNDGTDPLLQIGGVTTGGAGPNVLQVGTGTFATAGTTLIIGSGPWSGLAASGLGFGVSQYGVSSTAVTAAGLQTSGTVEANYVTVLTQLSTVFLEVGPNGITSNAPNTPFKIGAQGITTSPTSVIFPGINTAHFGLVGFGGSGSITYPTQTTVGAAGGASALPATPSIYLPLYINGTEYLFAGYTHT